jgi:hypothetical protein
MVWDFNSDRGPVEQFYPGDEAVGVISQDIYWNSDYQGGEPNAAWDRHFAENGGYSRGLDWMADFAAEHGKPMAIPEWGVPISDPQITPEEAAAWVKHFEDWVVAQNSDGDPGVAFVTYWNVSEAFNHGGRIENGGSDVLRAALRHMAEAIGADGAGGVVDEPGETPGETPVKGPVKVTAGSAWIPSN